MDVSAVWGLRVHAAASDRAAAISAAGRPAATVGPDVGRWRWRWRWWWDTGSAGGSCDVGGAGAGGAIQLATVAGLADGTVGERTDGTGTREPGMDERDVAMDAAAGPAAAVGDGVRLAQGGGPMEPGVPAGAVRAPAGAGCVWARHPETTACGTGQASQRSSVRAALGSQYSLDVRWVERLSRSASGRRWTGADRMSAGRGGTVVIPMDMGAFTCMVSEFPPTGWPSSWPEG